MAQSSKCLNSLTFVIRKIVLRTTKSNCPIQSFSGRHEKILRVSSRFDFRTILHNVLRCPNLITTITSRIILELPKYPHFPGPVLRQILRHPLLARQFKSLQKSWRTANKVSILERKIVPYIMPSHNLNLSQSLNKVS